MRHPARIFLSLLLPSLLGSPVLSQTNDKDRVEFFRQNIKPILVRSCLSCHGPEKSKGGLDLSNRTSFLEGGDHGPVIVAGKPNDSVLYRKIAKGEMPPKMPLAPTEVALFAKWIQAGADFDAQPLAVKRKSTEPPWSFRPIGNFVPPTSKFDALARNPIDRFLFARLEKVGLEPAAEADRLTLIRRVTIDLTGLPPTPAEIDAYLADKSAEAYEKVVDRLLASPAFGERWARHWLDVVRFGESNGYEQNHVRVTSWPYRDYVIQAFNDDKPYYRFVGEQIAGDLLGPGDPRIEPATGFLVAGVHDTVGNGTEEGQRQQRVNDLEDMVSTVGAAFLGLTVGCARCHDHKFDPISQKEYYRLAAVFAGVRHGERRVGKPTTNDEERDRLAELAQRQRLVRNVLDDMDRMARKRVLEAQGIKNLSRPAVNPRRNLDDFAPTKAKFVRFVILATRDGMEPCLDELEVFAADSSDNLALASTGAKATASSLLPGYKIHQVAHLNDGRFGNDWSWIAQTRGQGWAQIELPEPAEIARVVWGRDSSEPASFADRVPTQYRIDVSLDGKAWQTVASNKDRAIITESLDINHLRKVLSNEEMERRNLLFEELANLRKFATIEPKAYIGQFTTPDSIFFLKRGDVMQRGDVMDPGTVTLPDMPELDASLFKTEPGRRLALARWLINPKNPLPTRVVVNRLWQYHFGRGLVATPSDFGHQGVAPSHPELLDWLARDLMAGDWKLKRVHRLMVTSHAYRQSTKASEKAQAADGSNVLLARMPLRRMEAEALRDAMLSVSGKLDRRMFGLGFALFKYRVENVAIYEPLDQFGPDTWRRTIYALTPRTIREEMLATFDCPESAQRTPRRDVTTTPLQALAMLNGPFAVQQARYFAERVLTEVGGDRDSQVSLAFRLAFGREPTDAERTAAVDLVQRRGLVVLCRGLLNANEFVYY